MLGRRKESNVEQTIHEEMGNVITHGIGFVFSLIAFFALIASTSNRGNAWHIASATIYGASLVILYLCSTMYHAAKKERKELFQRLDHISIYLLIAGTYMPITMIALEKEVGLPLFGVECALCFIGVTFKAIYGHRLEILSGIFYLLMGWIVIFAIKPICAALPPEGLFWLFLGGFFYTMGFVFFALDRRYHFFHTVWHLFVMGGSLSHFVLVFNYVIP